MHRYTMKELEEWSDRKFIMHILRDRQETLTNPYSPLNQKIERVLASLDDPKYSLDIVDMKV